MIYSLMILFLSIAHASTDPRLKLVANLKDAEPAGVVVTKESRVFLTIPRTGQDHNSASLVELKDGKTIPFPDEKWTVPNSRKASDRIVSPLGITLEGRNLWVLDEGKRDGVPEIEKGAAKILAFKIDSGKLVKRILFTEPLFRNTVQLNDLRVDPTHGDQGTIFITNNGFAKPDSSIFIVDIASSRIREVFRDSPYTSPAPGFMTFVEGKPHLYSVENPTMPQGGVNGLELSPDNKRLFWTIPTNQNYYSLSTDLLSDFSLSESELGKKVRFEGQTIATGGITIDSQGSLYFGDASHEAIFKRDVNGKVSLVVQDERLIWPDGMTIQNGTLFVTIGQWQRAPSLNNGKDLRAPPYPILKISLGDDAR